MRRGRSSAHGAPPSEHQRSLHGLAALGVPPHPLRRADLAALIGSLRYRDLVPLVLALAVVERTLHAVNAWAFTSGAALHRPPEHYAVLVGLPLLIAALALSLRDRPIPTR